MHVRFPRRLVFVLVAALPALAAGIDLDALLDYAGQAVPHYVAKDNTAGNLVTDAGATLGRVLFYDRALSLNATTSCASCHQQAFAFGDPDVASVGFDGALTGRHSMRLVNARFADEAAFFWDERAATLEEQVTMPIQDHGEMGFSGTDGQPGIDSLLRRLNGLERYRRLTPFALGVDALTEAHLQAALAQFVRSIQSFDSRFDVGLAVPGTRLQDDFANFSAEENLGKRLYLAAPGNGGAGCQGCHRAPEFDIDPASGNNGVVGSLGGGQDLTNTRAPSLRDLVNPDGLVNGPFMHDGSLADLPAVVDHYDAVTANPAIDRRLRGGPGANGQQLNLTEAEKRALVAFLGTLTGDAVYADERWNDPFEPDGSLVIEPAVSAAPAAENVRFRVYPNPAAECVTVELPADGTYAVTLRDAAGRELRHIGAAAGRQQLALANLGAGMYLVSVVPLVGDAAASPLPATRWLRVE